MVDEKKQYVFLMRDHWWICAGIVGFFNIAKDKELQKENKVEMIVESEGLSIKYEKEEELRSFLDKCYTILAERYWNVSTKKQKENSENIYYDYERDELLLKPKTNPTPIPALFVKGSSWRFLNGAEGAVSFKNLDGNMQKRVKKFMEEEGKKLYGKQEKLLYSSPVCHKKIDILPPPSRQATVCSICGQASLKCGQVSQNFYLLFASDTATKSFNSELKKPDQICWECIYLSMFAIEAASYHKNNDNLFILQAVSGSLEKTIDTSAKIGCSSVMRELDKDYYYSNLRKSEKSSIKYTSLPYEFLWAFYCDSYSCLKEEYDIKQENDDNIDFFKELVNISLQTAPIQIVLLSISDKGKTFITKDVVFYNDTAYVFKLLYVLYEQEIDLKAVFNNLYNKENEKNATNFRNYFFRCVLNKRSVLLEVEKFIFHISGGEYEPNFYNLLKFLEVYETSIGGIKMTKEQVEIAVNLGISIVLSAKDLLEKGESKKIRGDLFALRKTRTKVDFLNQLNRLQFRYGLVVSGKITGGLLEEVGFEEFKAYCTLGALNRLNSSVNMKKDNKKVKGGSK